MKALLLQVTACALFLNASLSAAQEATPPPPPATAQVADTWIGPDDREGVFVLSLNAEGFGTLSVYPNVVGDKVCQYGVRMGNGQPWPELVFSITPKNCHAKQVELQGRMQNSGSAMSLRLLVLAHVNFVSIYQNEYYWDSLHAFVVRKRYMVGFAHILDKLLRSKATTSHGG